MFQCLIYKLKAFFALSLWLGVSLGVSLAQGVEPAGSLKTSEADSLSQMPKPLSQMAKPSSRMPRRLGQTYIRERLSFSSGINYSQGEYYYGEDSFDSGGPDTGSADKNTYISSMPFRVKYGQGDWSFSAQIPYIYITGPASVITVGDGIESDFTISQFERKRWGLGDLRLGAQYKLPLIKFPKSHSSAKPSSLSIDNLFDSARFHIGANIKIPTASEADNLGSGEFDYSAYTGAYIRSGRWLSNARLGYQIMGDTDDTNYHNRWYTSLGGNYILSKQHSLGLSYYFKQASSARSEAVRSLTGSFNWRLTHGWRIGLSAGTGFSRSSADIFGGFQITKTFVRKRRARVDDNDIRTRD